MDKYLNKDIIMKKNIAFFVAHFTERGTEVAIYDYARYNEEVLQNRSYIICFSEGLKNRLNFGSWVANAKDTYDKFSSRFEIIEIDDIHDMTGLIERYDFNFFYFLTHGGYYETYFELNNRLIWGKCKTIKHCVFMLSVREADFMICISDYLIGKYQVNVPVIPHIVNMPDYEGDLRESLGIPRDAIVLGRYGGISEFNVQCAKDAIVEFMGGEGSEGVYFLFMNTYKFMDHSRVIHLDRSVDMRYKVQFINTCDAMIHARDMGETFGLSIAEFSSKNKPVITCPFGDLEHVKILGSKGIIYRDKGELMGILGDIRGKIGSRKDWNAYRYYSPGNVMRLFNMLIFEA